jgi:hypothetical protein
MSSLSNVGKWLKDNRRWLVPGGGMMLLTLMAAVVLPSVWAGASDDSGVVEEWNDTIARLGIDPVFPPEEDIYVGDLFAVITADKRPGKGSAQRLPLLNRAIKLAHIDMKPELIRAYETLPIFPDTEKRPDSDADPWPQKVATSGLFADHSARGLLAIAAFPGFTIRHARAVSGGLSAWGAGLFGASRQDNDILEVKIPFAETYGVPSVLAAGKLARFCADPFTANVCTDSTLRQHLSYVTPGLFEKVFDPKTGTPRYLVDVEIALVNRVYLTRSIEQTRRLGHSGAAMVQAVTEAASRLKTVTAPPPTPKADEQRAVQGATDSAAKLAAPTVALAPPQKPMQDMLDRLDAAVPGGVLSVVAASDSQYELKQTFQRPIVIGYRAVRGSFPDELDRIKYTPAQEGRSK